MIRALPAARNVTATKMDARRVHLWNTAACHDRVDTFDTALMGHSLALQRLNEIKLSNGAQSWHARCIFPVERYCRGGKRAAMIKA
jgi:hypothetical protein